LDTTRTDLDLTNAYATVAGPAGQVVPPVVHRSSRGIVFEVLDGFEPRVGVDVNYQVTISGIVSGGVAAPDHTYVVTLVRPDRAVVAGNAPTVSGTARVGETLTATPGTWGTLGTYSDGGAWFRDGNKILHSVGQRTYTLVDRDLGRQIHYAEVGVADYYLPTTMSSAPVVVTGAVASPDSPTTGTRALQLVRRPKVRGVARVGNVLTAVAGTWRPAAKSSFRWVRSGKVVARGKRLRLTKAYGGKKVVLRVTAKRAGYAPVVMKVRVGRVRR
jgi:hypothetical protein